MSQETQDHRHAVVTDLAERLLAVATTAYDSAPKIVLSATDPDPPPLSWHAAFTSAQLLELLLRLLVLRRMQVDGPLPKGVDKVLEQCHFEALRALKLFNIVIAQEI